MRPHWSYESGSSRISAEAYSGRRRAREAKAAGEVSDRLADPCVRGAAWRGPRFSPHQDDVRAVGDGEPACLRGGIRARRKPAGPGAPGLPSLHGLRFENENPARRALSRTPSRTLLLCGTRGMEVRHARIDRMLHYRGLAREGGRAASRIGKSRAGADLPQSADGRIRRMYRGDRARGDRARLEWIVDSREHRDAFAPIAHIDEADHERFRDSAETDSAGGMQLANRVEADIVRDPADVEGGREL